MDLCTIINPSSVIVLIGRTNVTNAGSDGIENAKGFEKCLADGDYLGHHHVCSFDSINSGFYWARNRLNNGYLLLRYLNIFGNGLNILDLVRNLIKSISAHRCGIQRSHTSGVTPGRSVSSFLDVMQESISTMGS